MFAYHKLLLKISIFIRKFKEGTIGELGKNGVHRGRNCFFVLKKSGFATEKN